MPPNRPIRLAAPEFSLLHIQVNERLGGGFADEVFAVVQGEAEGGLGGGRSILGNGRCRPQLLHQSPNLDGVEAFPAVISAANRSPNGKNIRLGGKKCLNFFWPQGAG